MKIIKNAMKTIKNQWKKFQKTINVIENQWKSLTKQQKSMKIMEKP